MDDESETEPATVDVHIETPESEPVVESEGSTVVVENHESSGDSIPTELARWMSEQTAELERLRQNVADAHSVAVSAEISAEAAQDDAGIALDGVSAVAEQVAETEAESVNSEPDVEPEREHWWYK